MEEAEADAVRRLGLILDRFPDPPVSAKVPPARGAGHPPDAATSAGEDNQDPQALLYRVMTEPNFSVLATSGDLDAARSFMLGMDLATVASCVAAASSKLSRGMGAVPSTPRGGLSRFLGRRQGPDGPSPQPSPSSAAASQAASTSPTGLDSAAKLEEALVDVQPVVASLGRGDLEDEEEGEGARVGGTDRSGSLPLGATASVTLRVVPLRREKTVVDVQHVPSAAFGDEFSLSIHPTRLVLRRQRAETVRVSACAHRANASLRELVAVAPHNGARIPVGIRADSIRAVFGVDPGTLPHEEDLGHRVPTVLAVLRRRLAEAEGLTSEGVFRIAPDEGDTRALKHALNEQQWETRVDDVNAYAHLIKVWFRELPTHALSSVAEKDLMAAQSEEACAAVVRAMPGEAGERLRWLLAVLARVVAQSAVNRMNVHACAVVVGPNLYTPQADVDPLTALRMSQQAVDFLKLALEWWVRTSEEP